MTTPNRSDVCLDYRDIAQRCSADSALALEKTVAAHLCYRAVSRRRKKTTPNTLTDQENTCKQQQLNKQRKYKGWVMHNVVTQQHSENLELKRLNTALKLLTLSAYRTLDAWNLRSSTGSRSLPDCSRTYIGWWDRSVSYIYERYDRGTEGKLKAVTSE